MKNTALIVAVAWAVAGMTSTAAWAQIRGQGQVSMPFNVQPTISPYASPYANPYVNPYANPYGNPYVNPYAPNIYPGVGPNIGPNYLTPGYGYGYGYPQNLNNGYYRLGGININLWRAPSGYYYPWSGGYGYPGVSSTSTTIYYAPNAGSPAQAAQPPISTVVSDMVSFLDDQKTKGRIEEADYTHLRRRVLDLQSKERDLVTQGSGSMDPEDEKTIRRDLDSVSQEIVEKIHPVE